MANYSFVKKANLKTKQAMQDMIATLNETEDSGEHYALEFNKGGYVVVLTYKGFETWTDRAAVVRCRFCGGLRELFDGQIEFCTQCWRDW